MKLPDHLTEVFRKERGRDPLVVVRAVYDIQGNLGSTHVAADAEGVVLVSRPSGGAESRLTFAWPEIRGASARADGAFAFLEFNTAQGPFVLRFTGWDKPALDSLLQLREKAVEKKAEPVAAPVASAPASAPAAPLAPKPILPPLVAFCASVHAMIECDEGAHASELHFLTCCVPDTKAIERGRESLKQSGLDRLIEALPTSLNDAQKRCLMANLTAVAMVDGWLQSEEVALLDRFQPALGIADAERETVFKTLAAKTNLGVYPATAVAAENLPDTDGLTPLVAFTTAMLAMTEIDGQVDEQEKQALKLAVPHPEDIHLGHDFLHAYGLDHLLARLPAVLDGPQRTCLMANLVSLAMADGLLRSSEQALLARFKEALGLTDSDYAAIYDVLLVKNNLAVFVN